MQMCFNGATSMKEDLFTDVVSVAQAGFKYLEIWKTKLYDALQKTPIYEIKEFFRKHGVEPITINSLEDATLAENREEKFRECEEMCKLVKEMEASILIVVPSFLAFPMSEKQVVRESVDVMKEISRIAAKWGVKIGFEFLGFKSCSVNNLSLAWRIVQEVSAENVGLVIDTFHFFVGGSDLQELRKIPLEKIYMIHINDLPRIVAREPRDEDRIMPGDGVLPLKDFFSILKEIEYDGPVSIELFNAKYWKWNPGKLAALSYEKMLKFVEG